MKGSAFLKTTLAAYCASSLFVNCLMQKSSVKCPNVLAHVLQHLLFGISPYLHVGAYMFSCVSHLNFLSCPKGALVIDFLQQIAG